MGAGDRAEPAVADQQAAAVLGAFDGLHRPLSENLLQPPLVGPARGRTGQDNRQYNRGKRDGTCVPHTCWPPLMWISAPFTYEPVSVHST